MLKGILFALLISVQAIAAPKPEVKDQDLDFKNFPVPEVVSFTSAEYKEIQKKWSEEARKVASEMTFSESDLSKDFIKLRTEWLKVKTADQLTKLLDDSHKNFANYSADVQYFLAQMHVMRPLRGIVWKMRPLFEEGPLFGGNKSTHVVAIQFIRTAAVGMKAGFPHNQTDALIEYFTQPSKEMGTKDQFRHMHEFQSFLAQTYIPTLNEAVTRTKTVLAANAGSIWVWDNKMFYGSGSFVDGVRRFSGHGAAEMQSAIGVLYASIHDAIVFSAYNQESAITVAGNLGRAMGMDGVGVRMGDSDIGLTDKERSDIIKSAISKNSYLRLRNYKGATYGTNMMQKAYIAKKNGVENLAEAYEKLKGKPANNAMVLNPALFQEDIQDRLHVGVKNMRAVVNGVTEVRDPITGKTVTLNLPKFYENPPASLKELMAVGHEGGATEINVVNNQGESLKYRNYFSGRANAWDNSQWAKYVPSAAGKAPNYMLEARRVMTYSLGAGPVFGIADIFVQ